MPSDRSRRTDKAWYGYTGIAAQQGRVILDRDVNALQGLMADRREAETIDVIGPCGTPDDGFAVSLPVGSPPLLWTSPYSPPEPPEGPRDFLIAPGTMYLGGQRVVFYGEQGGAPVGYSYYDQPDCPDPPQPGRDAVQELVYLEVTEQEVSAVEDPDLLEAALGGPDTTQRIKLLRRVRRMEVKASDCATAWQQAIAHWAAEGLALDPATMRLAPQVTLQVGFVEAASSGDPCDPVATGGYLGVDNQLIRVRTAKDGGSTRLIWGYDNASFIYRITSVSSDRTMLTLATDPPDGFHVPQTGQLVEILTTAAVLGVEPDETDPTGTSRIKRVAARADGTLRQLKQAYGMVNQNDSTNYIVLDSALPNTVAYSSLPLFLRVWQADLGTVVPGTAMTLSDPTTGISTGVTVTLTVPAQGTPPEGAFWEIAVRPSTSQGVYPEALLTAPQPPDGQRRWACPLAVIDWRGANGPTVTDCRNPYDNLATLTRRKPGCCTVAIDPSQVTAATSLQSLIDHAAGLARQVTVCLGAGTYALPAPLLLSARHAGMTIESCGGPAILQADPAADPAPFAEGLVIVAGVGGITLRGLTLHPPFASFPEATLEAYYAAQGQDGQGNLGNANSAAQLPDCGVGLHAYDASNLTVETCTIALLAPEEALTVDLFAAAIYLQGACTDLTVRGCILVSQVAPTYTGPTQITDTLAPEAAEIVDRSFDSLAATFQPASPPASAAAEATPRLRALTDVQIARQLPGARAEIRPAVATAGIIAENYIQVTAGTPPTFGLIPCRLHNTTICDTSFQGFTFATWVFAEAATLRMVDNTALDSPAGFWLGVPTPATPPEPAQQPGESYFPSVADFLEALLLLGLTDLYPPPQQPDQSADAQDAVLTLPAGVATLILSGNQVQVRAVSSSHGTAVGSTAALLLALFTETLDEGDNPAPALSAIVSANSFVSLAGQLAPTAVITLAADQPCAITGNVLLNQGRVDTEARFGPSLWLDVAYGERGTRLFSATGNTFNGPSNLQWIPRQSLAADLRWHIFNADPS